MSPAVSMDIKRKQLGKADKLRTLNRFDEEMEMGMGGKQKRNKSSLYL